MNRRARTYAHAITRLRRILIQAYIREAADIPDDDLAVEFDFVVRSLPIRHVARGGPERRVVAPARRIIDRTGLLAHVDPLDRRAAYAVHLNPERWRTL